MAVFVSRRCLVVRGRRVKTEDFRKDWFCCNRSYYLREYKGVTLLIATDFKDVLMCYCSIALDLGDAQGQVGKRRLQGYWLAGKVDDGDHWDGERGALGTDRIGNQVVAEGAGRVTGIQ